MESENTSDRGEIKKIEPQENSMVLKLNSTDLLDLSGFNEEQRVELKKKYAEAAIDHTAKAAQVRLDVQSLDATLASFNLQTERASQADSSITIQHSQNTSVGRTEIIVGNTDRAASGKLSRTATGEKNNAVMIAAIIAIALVFAAMFLGKG
jgi:hypothetical protein